MVIVAFKNGTHSFAIYDNGKKVVESHAENQDYSTLGQQLGIDLSNASYVDIEHLGLSKFPNKLDTTIGTTTPPVQTQDQPAMSLEDAIADFNPVARTRETAKELGILKTTQEQPAQEGTENTGQPDNLEFQGHSEMSATEYIGADAPEIGSTIFVDAVNMALKKVTAGFGTVKMCYNTEQEISDVGLDTSLIDEEEEDDDDFFSETYDSVFETEKNVIVELEEAPGVFYSWTLIKDKQEQLKSEHNQRIEVQRSL
jgi:hypothetical protein